MTPCRWQSKEGGMEHLMLLTSHGDQLNETWHINSSCHLKYEGIALYIASQQSHVEIHINWKKTDSPQV